MSCMDISIGVQLTLRKILSGVLLFGSLLFSILFFYWGRITDIGIKNGIIIFVILTILIICLVLLSETLNQYADPVNIRNRRKYIVIYILHLVIIFLSIGIICDNEITNVEIAVYLAVYCLGSSIIVMLHRAICNQFDAISNQELQVLIEKYRIEENNEFSDRVGMIHRKTITFIIYLIIAQLGFEYILLNPITVIMFAGLNVFILHQIFGEILKSYSELRNEKKKYIFELAVGDIFSTSGIIWIYLIQKRIIHIQVFEGRSYDELGMVYILFFIPFLIYVEKSNNCYNRMTRGWRR